MPWKWAWWEENYPKLSLCAHPQVLTLLRCFGFYMGRYNCSSFQTNCWYIWYPWTMSADVIMTWIWTFYLCLTKNTQLGKYFGRYRCGGTSALSLAKRNFLNPSELHLYCAWYGIGWQHMLIDIKNNVMGVAGMHPFTTWQSNSPPHSSGSLL